MSRIVIIDYGMGNLRSVQKALELHGASTIISHRIDDLKKASGIVLPGVGAFRDAIKNINPVATTLKELIEADTPVLGICLGMQLFATYSYEDGFHQGLDIIRGKVVRLPAHVKIPHMGWNSIKIMKRNKLLENIKDGDHFYFVHSYVVIPDEKDVIACTTNYSIEFCSVLSKNNIYATQFHPEKSGRSGLKILKNFIDIVGL
ncbi:MAG: imidazole glycerol phosphate synthase subunit HisH [Candidatus Hydrothermarchaeota archaeon]